MDSKELIFLEYLFKINITGQNYNESYPYPASLAKTLEIVGMGMDESLKGWISPEYERELIEKILPWAKKISGHNVNWKTVYVSVDDVTSRTDEELKQDQTNIYSNPDNINTIKNTGDTDIWNKNNIKPGMVVVTGSTIDEIKEQLTDILKKPVPLSETQKRMFERIKELDPSLIVMPDEGITIKENLVILLSLGLGDEYITSINDVLRLALYYSCGLTNINTTIFHGKLHSKEKRRILGLIDNYKRINIEDTKRYLRQWIFLARCLHCPRKYSNAFKFFTQIYHNKEWKTNTWSSKYHRAVLEGNFKEAVSLLSSRPGEFSRRFDFIIRSLWEKEDTEGMDYLMDKLLESDIPVKLLIQLYNHVCTRDIAVSRSYTDTSGNMHQYAPLTPLPDELRDLMKTLIFSLIRDKWKGMESLKGKKYYININPKERIKFSDRAQMGDYLGDLGTIQLEKKGILRVFTQWIDPDGTEDIDLHALILDKDGKFSTVCWQEMFNMNSIIVHSGDVRYVKGNCAEYVSIDLDSPRINNIKQIFFCVDNYERDSLADTEVYVGVSKVDKLVEKDPDQHWVPTESTTSRIKIDVKSKSAIVCILDLETMTLTYSLVGLEDSGKFNSTLLKSCMNSFKGMTLLEALQENITIRGGQIVETPEEEDVETIKRDNALTYII